MWDYRRILEVSWTERVKNADILRREGKEAKVADTVKARKFDHLGQR